MKITFLKYLFMPSTPKDYRQSVFFIENTIDVYIRDILTPQKFYRPLHAYKKFKLIETPLHDAVGPK